MSPIITKCEKLETISLLTEKKVIPKSSSVPNQLIFCKHLPSFDNLIVLNNGSNKFSLVLREHLNTGRSTMSETGISH